MCGTIIPSVCCNDLKYCSNHSEGCITKHFLNAINSYIIILCV